MSDTIMTDHALVRWLERVYGLDVERLKAQIAEGLVSSAAAVGASAVVKDGAKFILDHGRIVTVLGKEQRVKRRDRKRAVDLDADAENGNGATPGAAREEKEINMFNVQTEPKERKGSNGIFKDEDVAKAILDRMRESGEIKAEVVTLTPAMARSLLERNPDNRAVSEKLVETLASDILAGRWQLNGEAVIVSDDGYLNDGQHRCLAVVKANRSIQTLLVQGVQREARVTTDMGRARTVGHLLGMQGVKDANVVASAALLLMTVDRRGELHVNAQGTAHSTTSKQEIRAFAEKHMEELGWAATLVTSGKATAFRKPILMLAAILLGRHVGRVHAEVFISNVVRGDHVSGSNDPIYVARERLLSHSRKTPLSAHQMMEIIIRAWNAHCEKRRLSRIQVMGRWPEIAR